MEYIFPRAVNNFLNLVQRARIQKEEEEEKKNVLEKRRGKSCAE